MIKNWQKAFNDFFENAVNNKGIKEHERDQA